MEIDFADFHDELAKSVLMKRYFWKDRDGNPIEGWKRMCQRVADAVASAEKTEAESTAYAVDFFNMMYRGDFLPNSPVLMNFGQPGALGSACFVLPIDDDMGSIFDTLKNTALIHRDGGGTGFNFSRLRPFGARVKESGKSSGVVSFMSVYNAAGMVIEQGGKRRGANMGLLNVSHPEIIKFIRCKEEDGKLSNFNISVALTDAFMCALDNGPDTPHITYHESVGKCVLRHDGQWVPIVDRESDYKYMTVQDVFDLIVEHAWENGEPGVFFIDYVNEKNPVKHLGNIETSNPCGEYAAIPYSSCNLGSINLSNIVDRGEINYGKLREIVHLAVRFLDNVIDVNTYPIPEIADVTLATRPVGLGVMGFADMLLKLGVGYGDPKSLRLAEDIMSFISDESHIASVNLGRERGSYLANKGAKMYRNCQTTTIAPTGTISMLAGCSSGIEPVFSWGYKRRAAGDSADLTHPIATRWMDEHPFERLPKYFVTTQDVHYSKHIAVQAAFQKHTDNGVSKTINMANDTPKSEVAASIRDAWAQHCNGITVYRDGSRMNQVLEVKKENDEKPETITIPEPLHEEDVVVKRGEIVDRPRVTDGATGRYRVGCGSLYITYNHLNGVPCEVFVNSSEGGGCAANSKALGMLISLALRAGVEPEEVIRTLRKVSCPACRGKKGLDGKSCADVVARAMEEMTPKSGDFYEDFDIIPKHDGCGEEVCLSLGVELRENSGHRCPDCGWPISHESGCVVCYQCGFSKCS